MSQTEAFARTLIDAQLKDQSWNISDGISVRYEYTLADGDRADYLLCGREGTFPKAGVMTPMIDEIVCQCRVVGGVQ